MANNPITCLLKKLDAGLIDKASVKRIQELTKKYTEELSGALPEEEAVLSASKEALEAFNYDITSSVKRNQNLFNAFENIDSLLEGKDFKGTSQAVKQLTLDNFQFATEGNHRLFAGHIAEAMEQVDAAFYKNMGDVDNLEILKALTSKHLPKNPALRKLSAGIRKSFDLQDKELRRLGALGHKAFKKDTLDLQFYMGHLQNVTKEEFRADLMENIDMNHFVLNTPYIDKIKGGAVELLDLAYDVLKNGASSQRLAIKKLGISPAEFKASVVRNMRVSDPAKWSNLQAKYGDGALGEVDVLSYVLNKSESNARYAAKLQHMGGNPDAFVDHIETALKAKGTRPDKISEIVRDAQDNVKFISGGYENHINPFFKTNIKNPFTGEAFQPVQTLSTFKSMGGFLLGFRATIAAFMTDPAYIKAFQQNLGFKSGGRLKTFSKTDKSFIKMLGDHPEITARLKLTIDGTLDRMHDRVRGMDSTFGSRAVNKGVTKFLRLSGMTPATAMNRSSNVMNSAFNLADDAGTAYSKLNPELLQSFKRFDITEADWKILGKQGIRELDGVKHMSPANILDENPKVGSKLAAWFAWAQESGTPTSSIRLQKFIAKQRDASKLQAGLAEVVTTFMGFSGSVWQNHMSKGAAGAYGYYAKLSAYTTLTGALTVIAGNTLSNKKSDPTSAEFWAESWNVGGSGAFFSDLIANDGRSIDRQLGQKLTSFTIGTGIQTYQSIIKNAEKALKGEETKLAADLFKIGYKFIPGQSLWYLREFLDETFKKPVLRFLDPAGQHKRDKRDEKEELI